MRVILSLPGFTEMMSNCGITMDGSDLVGIWASPGGGGGGGDWAGTGCATIRASATAPASSKGLGQRRDLHGARIVIGSRLGFECTSMTVVCGGWSARTPS